MTLAEFVRNARLHGLSDGEFATLEQLVRAAFRWQQHMQHVGDANNFNGTLSRAVDEARRVFGDSDTDDPHMHCYWKCVARRGTPRCSRDQPTVLCACGIENAVAWRRCQSCKQQLPTKDSP